MSGAQRWIPATAGGLVLAAALAGCGVHDPAPVTRTATTRASAPATTAPAPTVRPSQTTPPGSAGTAPSTRPQATQSAPSARVPTSSRTLDPAAQSARAAVTYLAECLDDELVQRPRSFTLSCGDGNQSLDSLRWSNWGADRATASGSMVLNTCEPSCANGTMRRYPVRVVASRLVEGEASATYRTLVVTVVGPLPAGQPRVESFPLPGIEPGAAAQAGP